ncbi:MAG: gliding motility protein GldL [Psychroflexus sp.]|jgi:gliding motility-associated protein GldL|nr:gliding motility protein GldL [Psychroflexus sp.]
MAQSKTRKKIMNMVYGLGAAVVILGALFKILHWPYGNFMLIVGLITEALVFTVSAFEPVDSELDWSKVYPELASQDSNGRSINSEQEDEEGVLSKKLDDMLKEAKIDANLMESLGESIRNFEGAAKNMSPTTNAMESQKKYSEEMSLAASQMESLNNLYKVQVENASKQAEVNQAVADNASELKEQMQSLSKNLSSLNGVYGNMLSAMSTK